MFDEAKVAPKLADVALCQQANAREKTDDTSFFRVQADNLEALSTTVGDLLILGSATKMPAPANGDAVLLETMPQMSSLIEEIRNSSLALRMAAIGESFTRYHQVARDIASKLKKALRLAIEGGDTESNKSVVEKISNPLMHLVRNALAHGLEAPAQRQSAGSPSTLIIFRKNNESNFTFHPSDWVATNAKQRPRR